MWKELGWLALAGAAGTVSRYGLSGLVQCLAGERFPWETLVVNLVETGELLRESQYWQAAGNLLANNVLGILTVLLGLAFGR